MDKPMVFYRYENQSYWSFDSDSSIERVHEDEYYLVRETPCGWWIHPDKFYQDKKENPNHLFWSHDEKPRWVSKTARKRFAYPTKAEALEGFKARKWRQIGILEHRLLRAKNALKIAESGNLDTTLTNSTPLDLSNFGKVELKASAPRVG